MPIYNPWLPSVDIEETRRYAGLGRSRESFPEELLEEACQQAKIYIAPKTVWEVYPYDNSFHTIMADEPVTLAAESIISLLDGAVMAAVMAVTIGERLEEEVSEEFTRGAYMKAILLDAAGTAAVEQSCDKAAALIARDAAKFGCVTGKRFSPGYGDFDLSAQPDVLRLAGAEKIGLGVTAAMMLVPRKSVTAIIGIYPYQPTLKMSVIEEEKNSCDICQQPLCDARKEPKEK